jgi:hypothetical protein
MITVAEKETEMLDAHLSNVRKVCTAKESSREMIFFRAKVRLSDARQKLLSVYNAKRINISRMNTMLSKPVGIFP